MPNYIAVRQDVRIGLSLNVKESPNPNTRREEEKERHHAFRHTPPGPQYPQHEKPYPQHDDACARVGSEKRQSADGSC